MQRKHCRLFAAAILLSFCGCTTQTEHVSPEDALFCENLADQVQSVDQLHIATETTAPAVAEDSDAPSAIYAMWFSVMDYADTLRGKTADEFRTIMRQRLQNAADLGINTVYFHVRAYQDAYYASALFPMGAYADPDIDFDPLAILLEEAHALHLSAHAWINPLRGPGTKAMEEMDSRYLLRQWYDDPEKNGSYLVQSDSNWWLNPAYPEVRQLIADGVAEIVSQYDVDGVHLDDYFYPTTDPAFDAAAFAESGADDLSTFRLAQTSRMVQLIYDTVKAQDQSLIVSISPQGTMRGNYDSQYADVQLWASETGYCDVLIPQIYYGFENETAPFEDTVAIWTQTVTSDCVSLVVGICTYKLGCEDTWAGTGSTEWVDHLDIPQRQVAFLLELDGVDGIAIYDYDTTFEPETAVDAMAKQIDAITGLLRGTGTT